jgi:transposase InsO family protein
MRTLNPELKEIMNKHASGQSDSADRVKRRKWKRPFTVHIDHTQGELTWSHATEPLGRPWLTLAIDERARRVLACHVTWDPPSYRSSIAVLRELVRLHRRLPDHVVVHGGKEFSSQCFDQLAARYKVVIQRLPPTMCRFGGVIERIFGTPGTKTELRTAKMRSSPTRLTLAEFDRVIGHRARV